ncbi:SMI1/KNR4 family protein [Streptomyces lomondensis]|nr:SMI1/KNR4 family protein [Streptomyces lomondensis]MCF0081662.1 SMI1/KNR4 family protein [Streptomyces lomondensis]
MQTLTSTFMERFQSTFGYPPDDNCVVPASTSESGESSSLDDLPQELITFYRHVDRVSLPDVGSGFFVHPVDQTLGGMRGDLPTRIVGSREDSVVVFGSDGGGALFALSTSDESTVYRLPPARVEDGVYTEGSIPCEVVAPGLAAYLSLLEQELQCAG